MSELSELPPPPLQQPTGADDDATPAVWRWLLCGFAAAWLSSFVLPTMFFWFLSALPHEMGHATVGCLLGHPSAPAISLRGHAWTGVAARQNWLAWAMAVGCAAAAFHQRRQLPRCVALSALAVLLPWLSFTGGGEVLIAAAGHLGELAFATFCFHMCMTGGRTGTAQERVACAMAGSLLQCMHLRLCFGLMTSAAARGEYGANGSLGMKNDMLVLAEDLLGWRLQSVAGAMLLLGLLPLPLGVLLGWWQKRAVDDGE